jgi:uncharacterized protein YodC (DUF2158 family)
MKPGDVVRLKSGGPAMTIKFVDGNEAYCEWFEKSDLKGSRFTLTSLEPEG